MRVPVENQDVQEKMHRYAVWAIPPDDVVRRIKKVMEGLRVRAEFGGPQIEPHITILGSILLSHERAVEGFTEACESFRQRSFKVGHVATRKFFYQCVSLFIHPNLEDTRHFFLILGTFSCCHEPHMPHLSLLYANLTEEERKRAREKVTILDESIASLSFPINRFELYKTNNEDRDQQSWEKVLEYTVPLFRPRPEPPLG